MQGKILRNLYNNGSKYNYDHEWQVGKDVEEGGHGLFQGTILAFT
jgi:hypothetical protein